MSVGIFVTLDLKYIYIKKKITNTYMTLKNSSAIFNSKSFFFLILLHFKDSFKTMNCFTFYAPFLYAQGTDFYKLYNLDISLFLKKFN